MLVDQIHHGRPLVNGPMPPSSSTAPMSYAQFTKTLGLRHLSACETNANATAPTNRAAVFRHLRAYGIDTIYLDVELADKVSSGGQAYRACIESLLNAAQSSSGSLWVYEVPAAS
jgi:predicted component of type VI protein secretion system